MFKHMKEIREAVGSDSIVLSLSLGKDSVSSLILCSMVFENIYCTFAEMLPGRQRDRDYADYLLKLFPKIRKLNFYPHHDWLENWNEGKFRTHEQFQDPFFENGGEPDEETYHYDYSGMMNHICLENGLDPTTTYEAVGTKMSDSVNRRISLTRIGYVDHSRRLVFPVRDFSTKNVYELLKYKGIRLHPDYLYYGSTFDGMAAKYWCKAYKSDPETWKYIEAYFPLAKAYFYRDVFKRQMNELK